MEENISLSSGKQEDLTELEGLESLGESESETTLHDLERNQMQIATLSEVEDLQLVTQSGIPQGQHLHQMNQFTQNVYSPKTENKSVFNVKDSKGSQINVKNLFVNQGPGTKTEEQLKQEARKNEDLEAKFIKLYNEETERNTADKITKTFGQLHLPSREVNPVYLDSGNQFQKGDTASHSRKYTPDLLYKKSEKGVQGNKTVEMSQFLDDSRYTALIGSMGSGKTTTALRFAKSVVRKEIPSLSQIKLVHYVSVAELNWDSKFTAYDLIFHQPMGAKAIPFKDFGSKWVLEHGGEILLVLDGLDQAPRDLWKNTTKVAYDTPEAAHIVVHNILCHGLIPGCKIITTSRPLGSQTDGHEHRPDKIISISQFKPEDRDFLIRELAGEKGDGISQFLQENIPVLWSISGTPLYLTYTVACVIDNFDNAPDTTTAILIKVLKQFIESKHSRIDDGTLEKLCELALNGTCNNRVVFGRHELNSLGLTEDHVSDLLTTGYSSKQMAFLHQSVQEVLSAIHIVRMELTKFQDFIQNHFNDSNVQIVKNIVAGILLNDEVKNESNMDVIGQLKVQWLDLE